MDFFVTVKIEYNNLDSTQINVNADGACHCSLASVFIQNESLKFINTIRTRCFIAILLIKSWKNHFSVD